MQAVYERTKIMMENKKVLFVFQEITPYLPESELSIIGRNLPQGTQEAGKEIRTFMPKFGCINERRNQLHEVIRLSGMNLVIDDSDNPLIIKVASIQAARMQVYFIDNEDYFDRKSTVIDDNGEEYTDNDERSVFFARGVLETVKKLRWTPDIIHCHGWMTSTLPLLVKTSYADDPFFSNSKVIYSVYDNGFKKPFRSGFENKVIMPGISPENIKYVENPSFVNISKLAIEYADGVIQSSEKIEPEILEFAKKTGKPFLDYMSPEEYISAYNNFYDNLL